MSRINSQKAMKCVPFAVNVCLCAMLFLTCTEHTSTTSPVNEMTISIKINVLIKFGASDMICVELRAQKVMKCVLFAINVCLCEMLFLTCTEHTSTTSPVNEMTISVKINVLIKFGASEMISVELRAKKLSNVYRLP